jgi:hypothetical protein
MARTAKVSKHLAECPECREAAELLRRFHVAGKLPLAEPPNGWVERAKALAVRHSASGVVAQLVARLVFDSWTAPHPVGVRGAGGLGHRRMRFESKALALDLRAEKTREGWVFVAQLLGAEAPLPQLKANRRVLSPDANGVYQWSSSLPPRNISLSTNDLTIEFPNLSWKTPRSTKR